MTVLNRGRLALSVAAVAAATLADTIGEGAVRYAHASPILTWARARWQHHRQNPMLAVKNAGWSVVGGFLAILGPATLWSFLYDLQVIQWIDSVEAQLALVYAAVLRITGALERLAHRLIARYGWAMRPAHVPLYVGVLFACVQITIATAIGMDGLYDTINGEMWMLTAAALYSAYRAELLQTWPGRFRGMVIAVALRISIHTRWHAGPAAAAA